MADEGEVVLFGLICLSSQLVESREGCVVLYGFICLLSQLVESREVGAQEPSTAHLMPVVDARRHPVGVRQSTMNVGMSRSAERKKEIDEKGERAVRRQKRAERRRKG
jgi:hypothetical protein